MNSKFIFFVSIKWCCKIIKTESAQERKVFHSFFVSISFEIFLAVNCHVNYFSIVCRGRKRTLHSDPFRHTIPKSSLLIHILSVDLIDSVRSMGFVNKVVTLQFTWFGWWRSLRDWQTPQGRKERRAVAADSSSTQPWGELHSTESWYCKVNLQDVCYGRCANLMHLIRNSNFDAFAVKIYTKMPKAWDGYLFLLECVICAWHGKQREHFSGAVFCVCVCDEFWLCLLPLKSRKLVWHSWKIR